MRIYELFSIYKNTTIQSEKDPVPDCKSKGMNNKNQRYTHQSYKKSPIHDKIRGKME